MEAGLMPEIVREYAASKPILGICLGHQCIGEIFGARLENMSDVVHGKGVEIRVTAPDEPLFAGVPQSFVGGRYHSWLVSKQGLPECLRVTAADAKGDIMALSHRSYDVRGLQFHPEVGADRCRRAHHAQLAGSAGMKEFRAAVRAQAADQRRRQGGAARHRARTLPGRAGRGVHDRLPHAQRHGR
jgi:GMP synthase-like glutamine amidotransferase